MEAKLRWLAVTAVAPIAWGSNYYVTRHFLPDGYPLWGAELRALPAGLLLLAVTRRRPRGSWWWKSCVLGVLNVAAFFVLVYVASQSLPSGSAATLMALSAPTIMLMAWGLIGQRLRLRPLVGAGLGFAGVCLMLMGDASSVPPSGVVASLAAMVLSSIGYLLATRWGVGVDLLTVTGWQLVAGGLMLAPVAIIGEGAPLQLDESAVLGFGYVTIVATAIAFTAWLAGLRHLSAATVGLLGLLNPVTGVLLGAVLAAEPLGLRQLGGLVLIVLANCAGRPSTPRQVSAAARRPVIRSFAGRGSAGCR